MPDLRRLTLIGLTVSLVAQLVNHLRHWSWVSMGATVWLALALSLLVVPVLRRHTMLRLALVLVMTTLSVYRLMLIQDNPVADTLDLLLTTILWRSFVDDEWPHLKRRFLAAVRPVVRRWSRPVVPLPMQQ